MSNITESAIVGWQGQPAGRGTYDILKTCGGTIFLLCWSSVCPNVPGLGYGRIRKLRMKFWLFGLAVFGPDFAFAVAIGQLSRAWRAKQDFRKQGYNWGLRHCFFVNMGGLHVQFPDRKQAGLSSFPIDCEQLLYLIQSKYLSLPEISKHDIDDRNKMDELARGLAIVQTLWFTISTVARAIQGLHITTLELTTLAIVFLMLSSAICWWRKPMDVSRPIILHVEHHLTDILKEANAPTPLYGRTPLTFLNRHEWFASQFWTYYTYVLRRLLPWLHPTGADCFASIEYPEMQWRFEIILGPLTVMYSCIFTAAWHFDFPTRMERNIWRASCILNLFFMVSGSLLAWGWHHRESIGNNFTSFTSKLRRKTSSNNRIAPPPSAAAVAAAAARVSIWSRMSKSFDFLRNLSPDKDPALQVPATLNLVTVAICSTYCFSRAYILIEDAIGLRSLPASAYQTVDWSQFSPIL